MRISKSLSGAFDSLLETAFPTSCVSCGEAVEESEFSSVCVVCADRIQLIESPKCLTCGFPFFGETESQPHCMHCEHLTPQFGQGWSVALFRGPVRGLIHALKYEGGFWALRDVGEILEKAAGLREYLTDAVLVPVPLHSRKFRERGYNQSALIVDEMVNRFPSCERVDLLERVVDTESQTQFNRKERIRNLKNAFSLRRNRAIDPTKRYILVDDVFTTGSTLNACSAQLRQAGVCSLDVLTIGHG